MRANRRLWMRVLSVGLIALLLLSMLPITVAASTFVEGSLPADMVVEDDVILAGDQVILAGVVEGDALCFGSEVLVTGEVQGSLIAAGANVTIRGTVGGSVYAAAQTVRLASGADVGRNVYVGAYGLTHDRGAEIERDLNYGGYQVRVDGEIGDTLRGGMAALDLNGRVGGDVDIEIAPPGEAPMMFMPNTEYAPPPARPTGLRVSKEAEIGGRLHYKSEKRQDAAIAMQPEGGVVYQYVPPADTNDKDKDRPDGFRGALYVLLRWVGKRIRDLISLAVLGALVVWLALPWLDRAHDQLVAKPGPAAGFGALGWIGGFVAAGVAFFVIVAVGVLLGIVTLGGLAWTWVGLGLSALGLVFCLFMLIVTYVSKLVVAYWVGRAIFGKTYEGHAAWPLLVGVLLYVVARGIPILGVLVGLVVTLFGMGALWLMVAEALKKNEDVANVAPDGETPVS